MLHLRALVPVELRHGVCLSYRRRHSIDRHAAGVIEMEPYDSIHCKCGELGCAAVVSDGLLKDFEDYVRRSGFVNSVSSFHEGSAGDPENWVYFPNRNQAEVERVIVDYLSDRAKRHLE